MRPGQLALRFPAAWRHSAFCRRKGSVGKLSKKSERVPSGSELLVSAPGMDDGVPELVEGVKVGRVGVLNRREDLRQESSECQ